MAHLVLLFRIQTIGPYNREMQTKWQTVQTLQEQSDLGSTLYAQACLSETMEKPLTSQNL